MMLTDDMTRLCAEIVAMRKGRGELLSELERGSRDRRQLVSGLCDQFGSARAGMAKRTKSDRQALLRNLRRTVHSARREMRSDLAGVRRAWTGRAA